MSMEDTEGKLKELLDNAVEESKKKGLVITEESIEVSKRDNSRFELHIGDIGIMQVRKFNVQDSKITGGVKCDIENSKVKFEKSVVVVGGISTSQETIE